MLPEGVVMRWGNWFCCLMCFAAAASAQTSVPSTASLPVPIVQLTAQLPRDLGKKADCIGDVLLREIQRQAVLISARDELGIATRDMVLREPFLPHGKAGVTTVLIESRITRGKTAELILSRFDGKQPADPYSLAEVQVDQLQNNRQQSVRWKLPPKELLVNYPVFVTRCEEESRAAFLKALQAEEVLGSYEPRPVQWATSPAPADAGAIEKLQQFDVFSQYLAVRSLHAQIRKDGASTDRLQALVRGYANLGALTRGQWSQADKVFTARALLYAQRLVVHDGQTPAALYTRAYSRAFAGLHAAALIDVAEAERDPQKGSAPGWLPVIRALCQYDLLGIEQAVAMGSWRYRPLAVFARVMIAGDDYPDSKYQDAITQALTRYPCMFNLAPLSNVVGDNTTPRPADQTVNALPVVLVETLKRANLPSQVLKAVGHVAPGDDSYHQLAAVRDRLNTEANIRSGEITEPSLAVLGDLIEQQEMVGVVHRAWTTRTGQGTVALQTMLSNMRPIAKGHPWGPYVEALGMDASTDAPRITEALKKINRRDVGAWAAEAHRNLYGLDENSRAGEMWENTAAWMADSLSDEFGANILQQRPGLDAAPFSKAVWRTSPHSAALLECYLNNVPADVLDKTKPLYATVIDAAETEFRDRPGLVEKASEICESHGEIARSFKLLQHLDEIDPSAELCQRLSRDTRWLGNHEQGIEDLMRGAQMTTDADQIASMYQYAAVCLIEDRRYTDAMSCLQFSADAPVARTWQLMARCYDAMGRPDVADECLRQQALLDPGADVERYLWARRLGRKDLSTLHQKAITTTALPDSSAMARFYLYLADGRDADALKFLQKNLARTRDTLEAAQLFVLATELNHKVTFKDVAARSSDHPEFKEAFSALSRATDIPAAMAAFDAWTSQQLNDEEAVDWYSLAGRWLAATGHVAQGKAYLIRAIHQSPREQENFYLAWRALQKLGENPQQLLSTPVSQ